ncbi:MAG: hypothetical protein QNI99_05710 [Woeseiaceae bacterium]|nr:hypothetical protein [Woeseiaceae bacterium]
MNFTFTNQPNFIEVTDHGRPETRDYHRFFDLLKSFAGWMPGRNLLIDDTHLDVSRMTGQDIRDAIFVTELRSEVFGSSKIAIYTPNDLEFGFNRMWQSWVDEVIDADARVCRSRDRALAWLAA